MKRWTLSLAILIKLLLICCMCAYEHVRDIQYDYICMPVWREETLADLVVDSQSSKLYPSTF